MQANDILIKKWCFGTGRSRVREEAHMNAQGELEVLRVYPKYRTIVLKVLSAIKKGKCWHIRGKQYSSLTGKPKKVEIVLEEKQLGQYTYYLADKQKRPFLRIENPTKITEEGIPPVGSLITVDKKHAIVTGVDRNQLTIWVNGISKTITCKPGTIRWHSDKILAGVI